MMTSQQDRQGLKMQFQKVLHAFTTATFCAVHEHGDAGYATRRSVGIPFFASSCVSGSRTPSEVRVHTSR